MDIIGLVEEAGYTPKRKAATHGGEYCSPCPFCKDGNDRFLIWPKRHNKNGDYQGGRYSCRVCGKWGDAITFLRELHGLSYAEACARLRIPQKERSSSRQVRKKTELPEAADPSALWTEKAKALVDWSHTKLMSNAEALALVTARGITPETAAKFKLGYCPENYFRDRTEWGLPEELKDDGKPRKQWLPAGIVIPTYAAGDLIKVKVRRRAEDLARDEAAGRDPKKYIEISGSKQVPSIFGDTKTRVALILESELDAILIQQFAADLCFCVALGGSTKPLDRSTDALLRNTPRLLFCPDFDKAGAAAWIKWKKMFPHIRRILTPDGKGAGDAYLAGVDLREWISLELDAAARDEKRLGQL